MFRIYSETLKSLLIQYIVLTVCICHVCSCLLPNMRQMSERAYGAFECHEVNSILMSEKKPHDNNARGLD